MSGRNPPIEPTEIDEVRALIERVHEREQAAIARHKEQASPDQLQAEFARTPGLTRNERRVIRKTMRKRAKRGRA